jgi:transcriptional antiterminator RfaH
MDVADCQWHLLQCKPREGARAEMNLRNQGYTVFHPTHRVEKRGQNIAHWTTESLFPHYLFIALNTIEDDWFPIRSTRGVARLITFNNTPVAVPHSIIERLRSGLDASTPECPLLAAGDRVRITSGCFEGLEAIFSARSGEARVMLLLSLLSRPQRIELPLNAVARL